VKVLPLTDLATTARAMLTDDSSLWTVLWDLAVLVTVGGVLVVIASRFFRWD
jgi:hypothetical protein